MLLPDQGLLYSDSVLLRNEDFSESKITYWTVCEIHVSYTTVKNSVLIGLRGRDLLWMFCYYLSKNNRVKIFELKMTDKRKDLFIWENENKTFDFITFCVFKYQIDEI